MVVNGAGSNYQRINNLPLFSPMSKIEPRLRRKKNDRNGREERSTSQMKGGGKEKTAGQPESCGVGVE